MKIGWNAIVKDEAAIIERCVQSLLPHIDCAIVADTGSTDGTPEIIYKLFNQAGKPVELFLVPFVDFAQARNQALSYARRSQLPWEFLLLADADMELRVKRSDWINGHTGLAYDMRQVGGSLSYFNRRLLSRQAIGNYVGVTHEYLDVASSGVIEDAEFIDHADGSNRPDKFQRDIRLLEDALKVETRPGLIERYHFYLAQSYFDKGDFHKAIKFYRKRTELGGFEEERWYAQFRLAQCYRELESVRDYVWEMLRAYNMRPQRVETLHDLSRFFRLRGENFPSLLFSEVGFRMPYPRSDKLFVDEYAYKTGLKEEFSICAYYDERRRRTGGKEANKLALAGSEQARSNLFWYLQPLSEDVPSFHPRRIQFVPPDGYVEMNPSVINHDGKPVILVRTVNYTITSEGTYQIRASDGSVDGNNPINTRNFIGSGVDDCLEIKLPVNLPAPQYSLVRGFEDSRLFQWRGELWTLSTVREANVEGWCEQVLAPLVFSSSAVRYGDDWSKIQFEWQRHEKNWMPWVLGDELRFVYRLGTLVDPQGKIIAQHKCKWDVSHISGGSQVVQVDRHWLGIVHEARQIPGRPNRYYQHRFVSFLADGRVDGISPPFFFHDRQIEFAAGLAYFPDRKQLMVSYGVRDCEAWMAWMDAEEVIRFVYKDVL